MYEGAALLCRASPIFVNFSATTGECTRGTLCRDKSGGMRQLLIVCSPDNPAGISPAKALALAIRESDRYGFVILADGRCCSEIYFDEASPPVGALRVAAEMGRADFRRLVAMGSLSEAVKCAWACSRIRRW